MAKDDVAVGDEGLLPVAPRRPDGKQVDRDDVLSEAMEEVREPLDALDPARALRALEDHDAVVAALDPLREAAVTDRLRPAREGVEIAGVVHRVDAARARWPGADLPEDRFSARRPEPLHVRETVAEAE